MSKSDILIAWELGSGLGHVGPLRAVACELVRRGHEVAIAAPNTELCRQAFAGTTVQALAASVVPPSPKRLKFPCTYSDLLYNCGYSSAENVTAAVGDWLQLFDDFGPDLLLADHSPTALLASRARNFATATIGVGFVCPPDVSPLPSLRKEIPYPHWAAELEQTVLDNMNAALSAHGARPVERVAEIFGSVDRQYLLTFEELDHYRPWRESTAGSVVYWPPVVRLPGRICEWPTGPDIQPGPRVLVYLRRDDVALPILKGLAYKRIPTLCYAPRFDERLAESFRGSSVIIYTTPFDLCSVTPRCDAAVLHGGHGTVAEFLRAGVPMLLLPMMQEQQITADRITELGAGLSAPLDNLALAASCLEQLLENNTYRDSAQAISRRLPPSDEQATVTQLVDDMEELIAVCHARKSACATTNQVQ